jgi:uncharacterized protein (DUF1499 family)
MSREIGRARGAWPPCPSSPNCVSSTEPVARRSFVEPLAYEGDAASAMHDLDAVLAELPRARVVAQGEGYRRVEVRSRLFGFVDDLELELDPGRSAIHVRSAARVGWSDLGVNRRRVEWLRRQLAARRALAPAQAA